MWLVHRKVLKKLVYNSFGIIGKFILHEFNHILCAFQVVLVVKNLPTNAGDIGDMGSIPGLGRSSGGGNGNSKILAWKIPWTEEPDRLQSMGSQTVGYG